jgi:hypothetical protein
MLEENKSMEFVAGIIAYGLIVTVTLFQLRGKVRD